MTKRETYNSFQDLDPGQFRSDSDDDLEKVLKKSSRRVPTAKNIPDACESEDEAALFLEAVAGNVDVSMKHSHDFPAARPSRPPKADQGAVPQAGASVEVVKPSAPAPPVSEEANLFADAMDGVRPINSRGRDLAPASRPISPVREAAVLDMYAFLSEKLVFSLEHTDEFVQGFVQGLDPAVFGKLKAGAYSPEGHVDLHGHNIEQAYATLATFVKNAYQSGKRHLIVVTGRGKNSPGGTPVLREHVQYWFTKDPFKRVVLGFCSAKPSDGGAGALYLLLRNRKKNQGKIVWDIKPTEEELLL